MEELHKLEKLAKRIAKQRREFEHLYAEMVELIHRASDKGASRREVARAADITYGRVQQILSGKSLSPRYAQGTDRKEQTKPSAVPGNTSRTTKHRRR